MDIENNSKNQLDKNFVETIKLFNENNINYWICHGTLLGIIRDRKLISWDHDIDIAVWYKEGLHEKIKNLMRENLFELKEKYFSEDGLLTFTKGSGREIDINFYNVVKNIDNNKIANVKWYVPKNNLYKIIDALSKAKSYNGKYKNLINRFSKFEKFFSFLKNHLIRKKYFFKIMGYTQPCDLLKPFKQIDFQGIKVVIPSKPNEYLRYIYGSTWQKPKKNFNWIKDSPSTQEFK